MHIPFRNGGNYGVRFTFIARTNYQVFCAAHAPLFSSHSARRIPHRHYNCRWFSRRQFSLRPLFRSVILPKILPEDKRCVHIVGALRPHTHTIPGRFVNVVSVARQHPIHPWWTWQKVFVTDTHESERSREQSSCQRTAMTFLGRRICIRASQGGGENRQLPSRSPINYRPANLGALR